MVGLEGVCGEAFDAVSAVDESLGAGVDNVCPQPVPLHLEATLVFAVDWLEPAGRHVVFKGGARKVPLAVGALDQPLGAGVQHVILH